MPKEWYLMTKPLFNSGYEKEEFEHYSKDGFSELLESFISTDVSIYETNDFSKSETIKAIIQNVTTDSDYNAFIRQILVSIGTIKTGYYVKYNDFYWLIKDIVDNNKIYEKSIMFHCNYNLRFISDISEKIVNYPVYMKNATQYNSGESAREIETIGSSKFLIYIPYNQETIKINHGKRFLIDRNTHAPAAFEVTQVDTISYNYDSNVGIIRLTVVESQFNSKTDNKDLMVADYYKQENSESWI